MNYQDFMVRLMEDRTKGIYLFDCKEQFLLETVLSTSLEKIKFSDFNYIRLNEKIDYEALKNSFETYPVMEEKKFIVWKSIDLSKNGIKDYADILDNLMKDMDKFPEYASLFIISDSSPFKGKFYKKVQKDGNIVEIERLDSKELVSFIGKRFTRNKKKIKKSLINEIIDRFSYLSRNSEIDLYDVANTVDKIISNSKEEIVSSNDVSDQLDEILNLTIFNLTDALSERDSKKAMKTYINMIKSGEDVYMIYHMIIRQVRNLIAVKNLYKNSYSDSFIQKSQGIGRFELNKLKKFSSNFKLNELFEIHDFLFKMENDQKSIDFDMNLNMIILIEKFSKNTSLINSL